ncbi:uncharacterized protein N7496_011550 [Penicillium cataractarum]|uniref:Uncharacterized protein n=1 Tax=Penicillium cataractarum TaxID=2100454 RepID=A0A9W9RF85_9EURO|nr:uncharacterized protein N7496_011550 [Penicillium cataractarum]KAJ5359137.1 hypothetical protein N7496_011550 [Penicillium cataractarum]
MSDSHTTVEKVDDPTFSDDLLGEIAKLTVQKSVLQIKLNAAMVELQSFKENPLTDRVEDLEKKLADANAKNAVLIERFHQPLVHQIICNKFIEKINEVTSKHLGLPASIRLVSKSLDDASPVTNGGLGGCTPSSTHYRHRGVAQMVTRA